MNHWRAFLYKVTAKNQRKESKHPSPKLMLMSSVTLPHQEDMWILLHHERSTTVYRQNYIAVPYQSEYDSFNERKIQQWTKVCKKNSTRRKEVEKHVSDILVFCALKSRVHDFCFSWTSLLLKFKNIIHQLSGVLTCVLIACNVCWRMFEP